MCPCPLAVHIDSDMNYCIYTLSLPMSRPFLRRSNSCLLPTLPAHLLSFPSYSPRRCAVSLDATEVQTAGCWCWVRGTWLSIRKLANGGEMWMFVSQYQLLSILYYAVQPLHFQRVLFFSQQKTFNVGMISSSSRQCCSASFGYFVNCSPFKTVA